MSWWNPSNWFNNRGGGGIGDHEREMMNDRGMIQETVFDGGPDTTTTFDSWKDYESGNPSGSYNWGGGPGVTGNNWANAFKAASSWNRSKGRSTPGYVNPWGMFTNPSQGVTKIGGSSVLVNPLPNWGKYQIINHPQEKGGGIGGAIGTGLGYFVGNAIAPGIGGKIGGSIGGTIGGSF